MQIPAFPGKPKKEIDSQGPEVLVSGFGR